ncbi:aminoacyl-tRNA hydrolase [Streptomyces sp. NPDC057702]|uniref:aminoacyl-tRNA hydrolase n=1 Tax=unclassified Streptomyces TaxID=2593676 RepID=UPI0036848C58
MTSSDSGAREGSPAAAPDHAPTADRSAPAPGPDTDRSPDAAHRPATPEAGAADPARAARPVAVEFVLPLVVRVEKADPPERTDALETAARAVLTLLGDERANAEDGPWTRLVRDWEDARIRKVVRRARGAEWRRAAELPGITVTGARAEVRVFPPVPLDGWPRDLAKLQVSGTELADPREPAAAPAGQPVLWLNPDLEMSAGKAMAQAGHGAQLAWWELTGQERAAWRRSGFALAVRTAPRERWADLTGNGLPVVRDAGFTEIAPGSCTIVADHPALRKRPREL